MSNSSSSAPACSSGATPPFELVNRFWARDTEDYGLEVDIFGNGSQQFVQVHFEVRRWAPSVLRTMRREWALFRQCVRGPLFAISGTEDDKWRRFVTSFGFQFSATVLTQCGEQRSMYVSLDLIEQHDHLNAINPITVSDGPVGSSAGANPPGH